MVWKNRTRLKDIAYLNQGYNYHDESLNQLQVIYVWLLDLLLNYYSSIVSIDTHAVIHTVQASQIGLAAVHSSTVLNFSVQTFAVI